LTIEIRPAKEDELAKVHDVVALSFSGDRSAEGRKGYMHVERLAHPTVLLDGGEIVAALRVYDMVERMNGAEVPMGGVSSVSCYPEHRRKGHVGRLLVDALAAMRDKGQALSALHTPHPALYRKYGYMDAEIHAKYSWRPKSIRPYKAAPAAGKASRVEEGDWQTLDRVYERAAAGRTGWLKRPETWWKEAVFRRIYDHERKLRDVVVWHGASGEAEGYAAYGTEGGESSRTLAIGDFVALTADAYVGLLRYVMSHDLHHQIAWEGPIDEPLAVAVDDSSLLEREIADGYMLRVVDIGSAIGARPAGRGAPDGAFTVGIVDQVCPWNEGAWQIENAGGQLNAASGGTADVTMEAATFAAVYNGYLRMSDAVRCGLAEAVVGADTALADRVLASDFPPYGSDFF
jgi:predicted acetyltransferase